MAHRLLLPLFLLVSPLLALAEINCKTDSCGPPFIHCSNITGVCEALKRSTSGHEFLPDASRISWDKEVDVVCGEDGYYPYSDCHSFYHCHDGHGILKTCDSPGYPYFDPTLERCTNNDECPYFDCYNKPNLRVGLKHKLSPFFAYCFKADLIVYAGTASRNANPHAISRCYGKDIFNGNTGRCEPRCVEEGLLPDTSDCHGYFLCKLDDPVNNVFNKTKLSCPQGQGFLHREFRCVPESEAPSCGKVYPRPI